MSGIIVGAIHSLAKVPLIGESFIKAVMIGVKYSLNILMDLDSIGSV